MASRYTITFTKTADGATKRTIRNVPPMNDGDSVAIGNRATVVTPKNTLVPNLGVGISIAEGDLFLQTASSTSVLRSVEITAVFNPGTSGARVTVGETDVHGVLASSGTSYTNVTPIPYAHDASVGMRGVYFTHNAPSGSEGARVSVGFIMLPLTLIGRIQ